MKIIKPSVNIQNYDGITIMKNIEKACRTCYRSENIISNDSYKNLLKNCINRGHESVLEHEKITVQLICDIGVYKDLTRHRIASFSIESTRYCNYGKDKFDNELKFIEPVFYTDTWKDRNYEGSAMSKEELKSFFWYKIMNDIESAYMNMNNLCECTPDEMRMILPHSTASKVTMTANIREWKHILTLRCSKATHPAVQQIMIPILLEFKNTMPEIFDSVPYNQDFDMVKLAVITRGVD